MPIPRGCEWGRASSDAVMGRAPGVASAGQVHQRHPSGEAWPFRPLCRGHRRPGTATHRGHAAVTAGSITGVTASLYRTRYARPTFAQIDVRTARCGNLEAARRTSTLPPGPSRRRPPRGHRQGRRRQGAIRVGQDADADGMADDQRGCPPPARVREPLPCSHRIKLPRDRPFGTARRLCSWCSAARHVIVHALDRRSRLDARAGAWPGFGWCTARL